MFRSCMLVALAGSTALIAAEGTPGSTSLRLSLGTLPTDGEVEVSDASGSVTFDAEWDTSSRLSLAIYHNFARNQSLAFNLGFGLTISGSDTLVLTHSSMPTEMENSEYASVGLFIEPGLAINIGPRFSLELGMPLGLGSATYEDDDGSPNNTYEGVYADIGLVARPVLTLGSFQAYAELGYLSTIASLDQQEADAGEEKITLDFSLSGATIALGIGYVF